LAGSVSSLSLSPSRRLNIRDSVIACFNHDSACDLLEKAAEKAVGAHAVSRVEPVMGSEDFALFTEKVPGAIFRIGCSNKEKGMIYPLHSPNFDLDETSLVHGLEVFIEAVKMYLQ